MLEIDGELYSLLYSELNKNKRIRYGVGYAEYYGELIKGNLQKPIIVLKTYYKELVKFCVLINILSWRCIKRTLQ